MSELGRPFLSPELRGLIARERHAPDPPDRVKREVAERIDRSLDLGGVMVGPSLGVAAAPPPLPVSSAPPAGGQPFQPPIRPWVPAPPPFFGWKTAGTAIAVVVAGAAALSLAMRSPRPAMNHVAHAVAVIHEGRELPYLVSQGSVLRALAVGRFACLALRGGGAASLIIVK